MTRPPLHEVPPEASDEGSVVALRSSLAGFLRDLAERADRGEVVAVAAAAVTAGGSSFTAWHDDQGYRINLIGSSQILVHRLIADSVEG